MELTEKPVLDATCGSRMIWFDKDNEYAVFVDKREVTDEPIWTSRDGKTTRYLNVHPDIIADFTNMPFDDNTFYHVVFDPPHMQSLGENAWLRKKYGILPKSDEWKTVLHDGFWECMRVLKPHGTLIFKWNEGDISTKEVLTAIGCKPLYGCRVGKHFRTHWIAFIKEENNGT